MIPVPPALKKSGVQRKKLIKEARDRARPSTDFKVGDKVFVLKGKHDSTKELVDEKEIHEYSGAVVIVNNNGRNQVKFTSGLTWWLNVEGVCIEKDIFLDLLAKYDVPPTIDLSHLDRLVIDKESKKEIVSVLKQHTNLKKIFEEWGLNEIMEYGKAMSMLFYGPPGTGKTWAANLIAKSLGAELLVISAAEIQTSEPGGANRNIQQAFDQARDGGHVLFLDECDGLITDRAHVGMILASEINTLLTCLEKFEGVVIFATNRADTLDPAMARRISLMLEFKNPDEDTRKDIWKVMMPKKMPLADDVTVEKLATFELTGGYIKNVILSAARLAVEEEASAVSMKHFARAIKRIKASKDVIGTHTSRKQDFVKARG